MAGNPEGALSAGYLLTQPQDLQGHEEPQEPMVGSLARGPKVLGQIPLNAHPALGRYLNLLEVHRLADELVVLWQLLARGQLDEHLTELTSTTTARGHSGRHSQALPTGAAPTRHRLRTERVRKSKATWEFFPVHVLPWEFWNIPERQPGRGLGT